MSVFSIVLRFSTDSSCAGTGGISKDWFNIFINWSSLNLDTCSGAASSCAKRAFSSCAKRASSSSSSSAGTAGISKD